VLEVEGDIATCELGEVRLRARAVECSQPGAVVSVAIRPERIEIAPVSELREEGDANVLPGTVEQLVFLGAQTHVGVRIGANLVTAEVANVHGALPEWLHEQKRVCVRVSPAAVRLLPLGEAPPAELAG
jgi:ABC-type Fe3+/spermidine/putrescine transport system ATPase subunit